MRGGCLLVLLLALVGAAGAVHAQTQAQPQSQTEAEPRTQAGPQRARRDPGPVVATVLGRKVRDSELRPATGIVLAALFERYMQDNAIAASEADIQAFVERNASIREQEARERQEQITALRSQLASPDLGEEERAELQSRLALVEQLARSAEQMQALRATRGAEMLAAERDSAKKFVTRWKLNRSLYERYGGRVIFQQAGPEPVDAYRAFLEEQQEQGAFEILEPEFEREFWRYFVDDDIHTFFSDEDEARKAIQTPWWLMDAPLGE